MKQITKTIPLFLFSLLLTSSSVSTTAFASATEVLNDERDSETSNSKTIEQLQHDQENKQEEKKGFFAYFFGSSAKASEPSKSIASDDTSKASPQEESKKSVGWFSWFSSKEEAPTTDSDNPTTSPNTHVDKKLSAEEELALYKEKLALYAKKNGREPEDLTQSIFGGSLDSLSQNLSQIDLNSDDDNKTVKLDTIQDDILRVVTDVKNVVMPIHASLGYFVEHRSRKIIRTDWFTGIQINQTLSMTPDKKYTFLKVATDAHESAKVLWSRN